MLTLASVLLSVVYTAVSSAQTTTPSVVLPWGTYEADKYESDGNFWVFSNVRFGQAPTSTLRFIIAPSPASISNSGSTTITEAGAQCHGYKPATSDCPTPGPTTTSTPTQSAPSAPTKGSDRLGGPFLPPGDPAAQDEDCLFMDLYVPAPALQPNPTLLPVVVWFYGGAYIFGAKDAGASSDLPLYDPTGMMQLLPGKFIFVASNYRMGAFGWLAGPTMEANAVPNVGLEDQRLALQFVRDRISLFGGDATKVSAWGQSAGAGSILHHLIAQDPDKGVPRDPLFTRAILQSPAFEPQWDQSTTGMAAIAFNNLTVLAGCTQGSGSDQIQCLQGKDQDSLVTWNQAIIDQVKCSGILPFGPAIDGKVIKHLPAVAFQNKANYWTDITSLIVSHVADESDMFTPSFINSNGAFAYFLNLFLDPSKTGLYEQQITAIQNLYSSIVDPHARASQVIRDSSFTCNTRYLFDAYSSSSSVYMMDYEFFANPSIPGVPPLAFHGADLLPLFYFKGIDTVAIWTQVSKSYPQVTQAQVNQFMNLVGMLSPGYQRYFVSLAVSGDGDPNTFNKILQPTWSVATVNGDTSLGNVNQVFLDPPLSDFHTHSTDNINIENPWCSFWANMSGWLEATAPSEVKDKNGQGTVTWFKHELRI